MKFTILLFLSIFGFFANCQEPQTDYPEVQIEEDGRILVKNNKYGIVEKDGSMIVPFEYDTLFYDTQAYLIKGRKKGKVGYIDKKYKIIIPFIYDEIESVKPYVYGFLKIKQNNRFGLVNNKGQVIIRPDFDDIWWKENTRLFITTNSNKVVAVNTEGEALLKPITADDIHDWIWEDKILKYFIFKSKERFGVVSKNGEVVIPPNYSSLYYLDEYKLLLARSHDFKFGIIDMENKVLVPMYDKLYPTNLQFIIVKKDDKYGVVDINNNQIIPFIYDEIVHYKTKACLPRQLVTQNNKHALMDEKGNLLTEVKYDRLRPVECFFETSINRKLGVIDQSGKTVLGNLFTELNFLAESNRIIASENSSFKLFDTKGTMLTPNGFDKIEYIGSRNFFSVLKNNKYGLINYQGEIIINHGFDKIFSKKYNEDKIYGEANGKKILVTIDK